MLKSIIAIYTPTIIRYWKQLFVVVHRNAIKLKIIISMDLSNDNTPTAMLSHPLAMQTTD